MWLFKLKGFDYSNWFLKFINSLCHAFVKIKFSLIELIIKWWKKSSKQLHGYKFLEDIQIFVFCLGWIEKNIYQRFALEILPIYPLDFQANRDL